MSKVVVAVTMTVMIEEEMEAGACELLGRAEERGRDAPLNISGSAVSLSTRRHVPLQSTDEHSLHEGSSSLPSNCKRGKLSSISSESLQGWLILPKYAKFQGFFGARNS